MNEALDKYARTSCHSLSNSVSKLPRELRDIIYQYLLDKDLVEDIGKQVTSQLSSCCVLQPCSFNLPHYFDREFVNDYMISDLLETAGSQQTSDYQIYRMNAFINTDVLHLGFSANQFFRHVRLRFHVPHSVDRYGLYELDLDRNKIPYLEPLMEEIRQKLEKVPGRLDRTLTIELWAGALTHMELRRARTMTEGLLNEMIRTRAKEFGKIVSEWLDKSSPRYWRGTPQTHVVKAEKGI